jgi:hypothetical protein
VNTGKSAVLATLLEVDDDRVIRVSATPGETTRCQVLPVEFDGRELVRFIDTPGFSRPVEAMRAIQKLHGEGTPDLESVRRFVDEQRSESRCEFEDEVSLLEPLLEGAGILYVIDPSRPLRDAFVAEMEILRWTGRPRMALLNEKRDSSEHLVAWKNRLGSYFNLVRTFNAHHARFEERKHLMRSLLEIDEGNRDSLEEAIGLIEEEWEVRREEAADTILEMLRDCLLLRVEGRLEEDERRSERKKEKKSQELSAKYLEKIRGLERRAYERLLEIYRHHLVEVGSGDDAYEGIDLAAEETWRKWGLSRGQLTVAGAIAGAAGGAIVDVSTGGLTHGVGTAVGAIGGFLTAFFKGADLPEFGIGSKGGLTVKSGSGRSLVVGPPRNENFAWILLDSALHHYEVISERAHGRREKGAVSSLEGESLVRRWDGKRRGRFAKWIASCVKGSPDGGLEAEVFELLLTALEELEEN